MIRRLKRQTKRRHSVQRDWPGIASRAEARRIAKQALADLSWTSTGGSIRADFAVVADQIIDLRPITEPIIGARLSPDVWAP